MAYKKRQAAFGGLPVFFVELLVSKSPCKTFLTVTLSSDFQGLFFILFSGIYHDRVHRKFWDKPKQSLAEFPSITTKSPENSQVYFFGEVQ